MTNVPEPFAEHLDSLRVGKLKADSLVVGNAGTASTAWTQITATLSGGALGTNPINVFRYQVSGKTCTWSLYLSQTGAGTQTSTLNVTLPVPARENNSRGCFGQGYVFTGVASHLIVVGQNTSTSIVFFVVDQAAVAETGLLAAVNTLNIPMTAAGWTLSASGVYEIA